MSTIIKITIKYVSDTILHNKDGVIYLLKIYPRADLTDEVITIYV